MDRTVLRESLYDLLSEELDCTWSTLSDELHLAHELGLDSVDLFGLLMQVERCFRVRFSTDDFSRMETVGDVLNLVAARLQQQAFKAA